MKGAHAKNMINIIPENDEREHERGLTCWCRPSLDATKYGEVIAVHNAADGRETCEHAIGEPMADDKQWLIEPTP